METKRHPILICRNMRKMLHYNFLWPSEAEEDNPERLNATKVKFYIALLLSTIWFYSLSTYVYVVLKNGIDLDITEPIAYIMVFIGSSYTAVVFVNNQPKITRLLQDLSNFEKCGVPPGFENVDKTMNFYANLGAAFMYTAVPLYNMIKLAFKKQCERSSFGKGIQHVNCGYVTPIWTPFETNYFPVYQIVLLFVYFSTQFLLICVMYMSLLALQIAIFIKLKIEHFQKMILECFEMESGQMEKFRICVEYHIEILGCAARLNECFSNGMFVHLVMTAMVCGCLEKQLYDGVNVEGGIVHITGWFLALLVACVGGQSLINAGEAVPDNLFSTLWYNADSKLMKDLVFVIQRSQKPLNITAGAFGVVSNAFFVSVAKLSYSILAYLRT